MKKKIISFFILLSVFAIPSVVMAGSVLETLNNAATGSQGSGGAYNQGVNEYTASEIVGTVVNVALGILGVVFIVLTIFAGYNYMTSQGDETKVKTSTETLKTSIIGLIIVTSAYAIWRFILMRLVYTGTS